MGTQRWAKPTVRGRSIRDVAAQIEREGGKPWRRLNADWIAVRAVPSTWGFTRDPKKLLRAAWRARGLFEELMVVDDGSREWEHLEPRVRRALDRVVVLLGGRARKP